MLCKYMFQPEIWSVKKGFFFKRACSDKFKHLLYNFLGTCILGLQYSSFEVKISTESLNFDFLESVTPRWPPLFTKLNMVNPLIDRFDLLKRGGHLGVTDSMKSQFSNSVLIFTSNDEY